MMLITNDRRVDTSFCQVLYMWEAVAKIRNVKENVAAKLFKNFVHNQNMSWTEEPSEDEEEKCLEMMEKTKSSESESSCVLSDCRLHWIHLLLLFSHVWNDFFLPVTCLGCNIYEPFVALINQETAEHNAQHDASQSQRRGEIIFSSLLGIHFIPSHKIMFDIWFFTQL